MNSKHHYKIAKTLADLLDNKFNFLGFKFGLDPILGLIWGAGDVVSFILSAYIIWIGVQMQLPADKISRMVFNAFIDFLLGLIPIIGQTADFFNKANSKNIEILKEFVDRDVVEGKVVT